MNTGKLTKHEVLNMVLTELDRAEMLHPRWPTDRIHQAAIVSKEAGGLIQACVLERYEPHKGGCPVKEAVQTAATAMRFLLQ
jgi:hypothetical protein